MHLVVVSPFPPNITGIGQYGYHVSSALQACGEFSRITVLTGGKTRTPLGALQVETGWQPESPRAGWDIAAQLQTLRPDAVWFNLGASVFGRSPIANLSGFLSLLWARRMGLPTIVTLHELVELADLRALNAPCGPFASHGARLITRIVLQADVVCLTMQRYVEWLSTRAPRLSCVHIPIGAYQPPELLPNHDARELLFFTTLAPFKGLELLLDAFESLQKRYPDLRLTIAGAEHTRFPGYAKRLHRQYDGLTGLRWLGQVPEEQVRELFLHAQIVTLPYGASTGSSSILYQAAAWGRPLVASDLPEIQAVTAESGLDITFFKHGSAASLAEALGRQLDSPELRCRQVDRNFASMQHNRPENTCRAYLQAFNLALQAHKIPKRVRLVSEPP